MTATATLTCSFGVAPAVLVVPPASMVLVEGKPAAVISDIAMGANVPPFGMCSSLANPAVVSATTAALGVLTPMPCTPALTPWKPPVATVLIGGKPATNQMCTSNCGFGGVVTVTNAGSRMVLG